jgi:hypothetical protein
MKRKVKGRGEMKMREEGGNDGRGNAKEKREGEIRISSWPRLFDARCQLDACRKYTRPIGRV